VKLGFVEDLLGDRIVATGRIEHALVVAAADRKAEDNSLLVESVEYSIVEFDGLIDDAIRVDPTDAVTFADLRIEQGSILRCVDLDVGAAEANQFLDLAPQ
jgi:hypothetical protein